jgi:hypothetical protein
MYCQKHAQRDDCERFLHCMLGCRQRRESEDGRMDCTAWAALHSTQVIAGAVKQTRGIDLTKQPILWSTLMVCQFQTVTDTQCPQRLSHMWLSANFVPRSAHTTFLQLCIRWLVLGTVVHGCQ